MPWALQDYRLAHPSSALFELTKRVKTNLRYYTVLLFARTTRKIDVTDEYGMTPLHYKVRNAVKGKGAVMFQTTITPPPRTGGSVG